MGWIDFSLTPLFSESELFTDNNHTFIFREQHRLYSAFHYGTRLPGWRTGRWQEESA
jgi:hypothetical protein